MTQEIRHRVLREATPEERERHRTIRDEIGRELPELAQWAREAAARRQDSVAVGTVFAGPEVGVLAAIDDYATKHSLGSRGAVVREALAKLLGIEIARQ